MGRLSILIVGVSCALMSLLVCTTAFSVDRRNPLAILSNSMGLSVDSIPPHWFIQANGIADGLDDVVALDTLTAWAVGALNVKPVIFHTSDGGAHWNLQPVYTTYQYIADGVSFPDVRHGWVVGYGSGPGAPYLSTSDGGQSWQEHDFPARFSATRVKFVDSLYGWITGSSDTVLHTTDGGSTWIKQLVGNYRGELLDLDFIDRNHGWAVGGGFSGPLALRTTDGGSTWQRFHPYYDWFHAVDILDTLHGWFSLGEGGLSLTSDGGSTWVDLYLPGAGNNRYTGISFIDSLQGWIAGYGGFLQGEILRTTDGGLSWFYEIEDSLAPLRRIAMVDARHGWAVGEYGVILKYSPELILGDVNVDGLLTSADVVLEINKVFLDLPYPAPENIGDVNCDGDFSPADVVLLLNRVFLGTPLPCAEARNSLDKIDFAGNFTGKGIPKMG